MASRRETTQDRHARQRLFQLIWIALAAAAVVKELRTPAEERTWHGVVARFVPYDFRPPTITRVRERLWAPDDERIVVPQPFGVGWTVNVGRVVALVRQVAVGSAESGTHAAQ